MRQDGRCEVCGCMIADGYEVERGGRVYHTACDPNAVPAAATEGATLRLPRRTGYEGTVPKENAALGVGFPVDLPLGSLAHYTEDAVIERLLS